jgi:hypothetical protein
MLPVTPSGYLGDQYSGSDRILGMRCKHPYPWREKRIIIRFKNSLSSGDGTPLPFSSFFPPRSHKGGLSTQNIFLPQLHFSRVHRFFCVPIAGICCFVVGFTFFVADQIQHQQQDKGD